MKVATPTAAGEARLILNSLSPEPGMAAEEGTVLVADLNFEVPNFQQGQYFVCAQFSTNTPDTSSDGDFPNSEYPVVTEPEGQLQFRFPIRYVWKDPEIVRPFRVWFYLNRRTGPHESIVVAKTGPFQYK